jgi:hypothetical protein
MSALMQSLPSEAWVMAAIGFVSLIAVAMPLYRGVRVVAQAWAATRFASAEEIRGVLSEPPKMTDPLGLVMVRVLGRAQDDNVDGYPAELLRDASRQYVINEYEVRYAEPIAMYANILPPIGFIGTTVGMLVLFVSLHLSDGSLQIGALGIALCSTIFALLGLAILEHCKIGIYNRLLRAIDAAMNGEFETSDESGSPVKPELAIVT